MYSATLTKWGNSIGVRIPHALIEKSGARAGDRYDIQMTKDKGFELTLLNDPHESWQAAFNEAAANGDDQLIITGI